MLTIAIRTDNPETEVGLFNDQKRISYKKWHAHRDLSLTLHAKIQNILTTNRYDWNDIQGIVVFKGPGSFTGLRIGLTVANALAYGLTIPIVGTMGRSWIKLGIAQLYKGENQIPVLPEYGQEPHITKPKR